MEMSVADIVARVEKIHAIMERVMVEGVHYGKVPGVEKDFLFKAGAEILGTTFMITPKYTIAREDFADGHREYEIIVDLYHMETGKFLGQGVGNCSTMESKYRFREDRQEINTGNPVPQGYWKIRKTDPGKARAMLGVGHYPKKTPEGQWMIFRAEGTGEKIENPNIADSYNTVKKMAKKRGFVDAIISATSASDVFTQDEDLVEANTNVETENGTVQATVEDAPSVPAKSLDEYKDEARQIVKDMNAEDLIESDHEYDEMMKWIDEREVVNGKGGIVPTINKFKKLKAKREKEAKEGATNGGKD
jgi:hypothetical protein